MPAPTENLAGREASPNGPFYLNRYQIRKLMNDNRTTLILNRPLFTTNFGTDGELFNLELCDPIRLVRVRQYDGSLRMLIQDGNHRVIAGEKYAARENIPNDRPYLPARDVTKQFSGGPDFITPEQFLSHVITPTKEHTKIAPERMAYTLFSQWEQMVGPEVAQRFSVLGALTYPPTEIPPTLGLSDSDSQRANQQTAHLKQIVDDTKYPPQQMISELLTLISKYPDTDILGRDQATQLIQGVFLLPTVASKLEKEFGEPGTDAFNNFSKNLASAIVDAMTTYREKQKEVRTIYQALLDPTISARTLRNIMQPQTKQYPSTRYQETKQRQKIDGLKTQLRKKLADDTPEYARALPFIERLARSTDYSPDGWQIDSIVRAARALHAADEVDLSTLPPAQREQLETVKKHLIRCPIIHLTTRTDSLEKLLTQLQQGTRTEVSSSTSEAVSDRNRLRAQIRYLTEQNAKLRNNLEKLQTALEIAQRGRRDAEAANRSAEQKAATLSEQLAATQEALRLAKAQLARQPSSVDAQVIFDAPSHTLSPRKIINWESVTLADQDWKTTRWIKEADERDLERMTLLINNLAKKSIFPQLKSSDNWSNVLEQITYTLSSGETVTGLDALHYGLTPRLRHAAEICGWTRESPEVRFLIGNHFVNAIGALSPNKPYMETAVTNIQSNQFRASEYFFDVLKMLLYTDPEDLAHIQALACLRDRNGDRNVINRWRQRHPDISFEDFVQVTIRGKKRKD